MTNPSIQYIQQKLCLNYFVKTILPKPEVYSHIIGTLIPYYPPEFNSITFKLHLNESRNLCHKFATQITP